MPGALVVAVFAAAHAERLNTPSSFMLVGGVSATSEMCLTEELIVDDIPIFERAFLNPCGVFVQNLFEGLFVFARKPFKSLQLLFPTEALDKYMYTYPLA